MEQEIQKSASWNDGDLLDSTADPNISISTMQEEVPTLNGAAILGVTVVIIIAIAVVFVLGVLIDCRQQRILEKKIGEVRRKKNLRRAKTQPQSDVVGIVNCMEDPGLTVPPADVLRNIP
ncbi:unnamed protein product [Parnassius apollo]|uniref:(apollo) hypothetical protein n=1 Tax=Parnassius apollo TaxID=110799 RepID=A0A8S3WTP6_PARAO|nr:unnamed protein product [Parnassius apollo]